MKYYKNESRFNSVYSRDNLPNKIRDGAYVINPDEYSNIGTHWVALYVKNNDVTYFDSFRVEHIPKEIIKFINRPSQIFFHLMILKEMMIEFWVILWIIHIYKKWNRIA